MTEIGRDRLRAEREEAALVWHAQAQGDAIEHRSDERHASVEHVAVITTGDRRQGQGRRKAVQRAGSAGLSTPSPSHRRSRASQGRGAKAVSN